MNKLPAFISLDILGKLMSEEILGGVTFGGILSNVFLPNN